MKGFFGGLYDIPLMSLLPVVRCGCGLKCCLGVIGWAFSLRLLFQFCFAIPDAALAGKVVVGWDGMGSVDLFLCFYIFCAE